MTNLDRFLEKSKQLREAANAPFTMGSYQIDKIRFFGQFMDSTAETKDEMIRVMAEALNRISQAKGFTRLADCCVEKSCHIHQESRSCSFQTGVHYGNCDRASEADEALARVEQLAKEAL